MSTIDTRVVELKFDNEKFGKGVEDSLKDLDKLKEGLKLEGATSGLAKVGSAVKDFSMAGMESAVQNISSKFSAMGAIGFTVLQNLTNSAINFGKNAFSSILDPIIQGGERRSHNIEQAKFQFEGLGLNVEEVMKNALDAVRGTAYGLDAAAKVASQFGASGIKAGKDMTGALRGVAGLAAMTGSSYEDIGQIFTTVAGNGKLMTEQLYQFSSRGMNVAAALGKQMGKSESQVRTMITKGKLDFQTFANMMDKAFGAHATDANKTYSGSLDNMKAALSRIGAAFATPKFETQRDIFNALSPAIDKVAVALKPVITLYSELRHSYSSGLVKFINGINFDGLTKSVPLIVDGIRNLLHLASQVIGPFKAAFKEIFPPVTGEMIIKIATALDNFTKKLILSDKTVDNLKRTFKGVFAIFDIFFQLIKAGASFVVRLFSHFTKGTGNITNVTARVGDMIVKFDEFLKKGDVFGKFFDWLAPKIERPVDAIKHFIAIAKEWVTAVAQSQAIADILQRIRDNTHQVADAGDKLSKAWTFVKGVFSAVWETIHPIVSKIGGMIADLIKGAGKLAAGLSFHDLLATGGLAGFLVLVKNVRDVIKKFTEETPSDGNGFMDKVKESLDSLTGTLESMQQTLKATALLEIAAAIAILTIAVSVLSKIDAGGLTKATVAMVFMLGEITGALVVMDKALKDAKGMKLDMLAAALILIAIAVDVLASAVKKLAELDWNELVKGVGGTVVLLGALTTALRFMPEQGTTIKSAIGIAIIAGAIKVLASAVKDIADLEWEEIGKGLGGVAVLLGALALYTKFSEMSSIGDGAGILLIAAAIKVLASAMTDIADLEWEEIGKGLLGVAGGLTAMVAAMALMPDEGSVLKNSASMVIMAAGLKVLASAMTDMSTLSWEDIGQAATAGVGGIAAIVGALQLMPETTLAKAAALVVVAGAVKVLASAMDDLGGMTWSDIAAGLVALAGGLIIMVGALNAMDGSIPGALALLAASPAIAALASAMSTLGSMSWADIGAALVALAGGLAILAVGLYAMEGTLPGSLGLLAATPGINALAGAMQNLGKMSWSDIGAALGALSGGLLALAIGLTAMIITLPGSAGLAAAAPSLGLLAAAMQSTGSMSWADIGAGIVAIGGSLVALAVGLTAMVASLPGALALAVAAPALEDIANAMKKIGAMSWSDIGAAAGGIAGFLAALAVGSTTSAAIAALGAALLILAPGLSAVISSLKSGVKNLGTLADNLTKLSKVNSDNLGSVTSQIKKLTSALPGLAEAVNKGITNSPTTVVDAGKKLADNFVKGLNDRKPSAFDAGHALAGKAVDGIKKAVSDTAGTISGSAQTVGKNIVDGVEAGVRNNQGTLNARMRTMATTALQQARNTLGIKSPSRAFQEIGKFVVDGFALGLTGRSKKLETATDALVNDMKTKFSDAMQALVDSNKSHNDKIKQLREGLAGNAKDISAARARLNEAINAPVKHSTARNRRTRDEQNAAYLKAHNDAINRARADLQKLTDRQNQYNKAISAEQKLVNENSAEYKKLVAARDKMNKMLATEQKKLNDLTVARDENKQAIEDQSRVLEDAIKTRDDYNKSLHDQLDTLESISSATKLSDYVTNLQDQIVATQQFTTAIQELRKRGLNDEMYKMLLAKGPTEGMPFVQQLLEGGQEAVDNVNYLGTELDKAASVLSTDAANSLYQAGVDAAEGLLKGLQDKAADIQAQMDKIAKYMVDAIKKELGIKSPSRVMAEIGSYAAQGLAKGLNESSDLIGKASESAGQSAIDGMKKTLSGLGALVSENMDVNPTITPVLDLSAVQKDASTISDLLSMPAFSVGSVYAQANDAAAGYAANQAALLEALTPAEAPASVSFTQINNSPKALSSADIYRQTNNQISVAKGALTTSARKS